MKRLIVLLLALASPALGQSYPSPTYQNLTVLGTVVGGTVSASSTAVRAFATRGADWRNVLDFGAVGNGTTDDSAAFNGARGAAQVSGGMVVVPGGYTYNLGSGYYTTSTIGMRISGNVRFTGSGAIQGSVDMSSIRGGINTETLVTYATGSGSTITNGGALELQLWLDGSGTGASYEKWGFRSVVNHNDSGIGGTHDLLAGLFDARVSASGGRAWGIDSLCSISTNVPGHCVAGEFFTARGLSTPSELTDPNESLGLVLWSGGNSANTAGIVLGNDGQPWLDGIVVEANGISRNFLDIRNSTNTGSLFTVSAAGVVSATGFNAGASVGVSCAAGSVNLATLVVSNGIVTHC